MLVGRAVDGPVAEEATPQPVLIRPVNSRSVVRGYCSPARRKMSSHAFWTSFVTK